MAHDRGSEPDSGGRPDLSRRRLLALSSSAMLGGLAGCPRDRSETPTVEDATPTDTPPPEDATSTDATDTPPGETAVPDGRTDGTETTTEEPDTAPETRTEVDVTDYGATPDDESDDTEAIRAAFAAADPSGATVTFEPGTYTVSSRGPVFFVDQDVPLDQPLFDLSGYTDLTVEGDGATLSVAGRLVDGTRHFAPMFRLRELSGFEMRDLTVDWDRDLPHTAGTVVEDTPDYVDLEVNEPYTPREGLFAVSFIRYDTDIETVAGNLLLQGNQGARCEAVSDGVLRCAKSDGNSGAAFAEGETLIVRHAHAAGVGIKAYDCTDLTFDGITIHSAPGMAVNVHGGEDVTMTGVEVVEADEAGRLQSATRDAFHVANVAGDLTLSGVVASRTGDDAFNLKGRRYPVSSVPDARTLVVERPALEGWFEYVPFVEGDEIEVGASPQPFVPDVTRELATFEKSATDRGPGVVRATYRLGFAEDLPESVLAAQNVSVFNATQMPDEARLVNATARAFRGGCRFSVDHLTIENCTFDRTKGNPMLLEVNPVEGEPASDLTVRDNTFIDAAHDSGGGALITTFPHGYGREGLEPGFYANHTYEGNEFRDIRTGFPAINLDWISDVTVRDNDFSGISGTDPAVFGSTIDCETITVDGETVCP